MGFPPRQMYIFKYIPEGLYGFAEDDTGQVFFHLGTFDPGILPDKPPCCASCNQPGCTWWVSPPPILGEPVEVILRDVQEEYEGQVRAPKAQRVQRLEPAVPHEGTVDVFDSARGFGWVLSEGTSYHLHRSEIADGKLPQHGQRVVFYAGTRKGKPRACHVKVCG